MAEHGIRPALALHVQKRSPALPACPGFTPRSAIRRARFTRLLAFLLARHGDCTAFCLKNLRFREPPARMGPAHHPISAYPRVPPPPLRPWLTVGSSGSSRTHHPPGHDPSQLARHPRPVLATEQERPPAPMSHCPPLLATLIPPDSPVSRRL